MHPLYRERLLCFASLAIAVIAAIPATAMAQPTPSCTFSVDEANPFPGESITANVTFDNTGSAIGFVPSIEFYAPAGLTPTAASFEGLGVTVTEVGTFDGAGPLVHPVNKVEIEGPTGATLYVLEYPLSSYAPSGPLLPMEITLEVDPGASVGGALAPGIACQFSYGADALNNPTTDVPPRTDDPSAQGDQLEATVTPSVLRVEKTASTSETVTGPNFPVTFTLALRGVNGGAFTDTTVTDVIDENFLVTGVTTSAGSLVSPAALPASTPGSSVEVSIPSFTGAGPGSAAATITITGYFPELNAFGDPVLPVGGSARAISNTMSVTGTSYDGGPPLATPLESTTSVIARPILVRADPGATNAPGATGTMSLLVEVSDYVTFNNVTVTQELGDGLTESGNFNPAGTATGSDPTTIEFMLGALAGSETGTPTNAGGVRVSMSYDYVVDQTYADGTSVFGGDVIANRAEVVGAGAGGTTSLDMNPADVNIIKATFTKTLSAINGAPPNAGAELRPGDTATFRLTASLTSGDNGDVILTDFLPAPIFAAAEHGDPPTIGGAASGAPIRFGPSHSGDPVQSVSVDSIDNSITFDFGQITSAAPRTIELLLTYTMLDEPVDNDLTFTNLAQGRAQGRVVTTTDIILASVVSRTPVVEIEKTADVTTADAGDVITFTVTLENTGGDDAFDVTLREVLGPKMLQASAGADVEVRDASNGVVATTGDLFGAGGLVLDNAIPAGETWTLTFKLELTGAVRAQEELVGVTQLVDYKAVLSGSSYLDTPVEVQETVTVPNFVITKILTPDEGTIRDTATYTVEVVVPEGTHDGVELVETLSNGLGFVDAPPGAPTTASAGLGFTAASASINLAGNGLVATWDVGTITNTNRDDAQDEVLTYTFDVVLLNNGNANRGNNKRATTRLSFDDGDNVSRQGDQIRVREPVLTVASSTDASTYDNGDTATVTVTVANPSATSNGATAHELSMDIVLPAGLVNLRGFTPVSGVTGASSAITDGIRVTWPNMAQGEESVFTFLADVTSSSAGGAFDVPATLTWTGQPGDASTALTTNYATSVERTGAGGAVDDYTVAHEVEIVVAPVVLSITRTSAASAPIGALVTYDVVLEVPESTIANALVELELPEGLAFVSTSAFAASASISCAGTAPCPGLGAPAIDPDGVTWTLGDVANSDVDNTTTESITFTVTAQLDNILSSQAGSSFIPSLAFSNQTATPDAVAVLEPVVAITHALAPTTGDAGDTITVTTTLSASGGTTAHDVVVSWASLGSFEGVGASYTQGTCPAALASAVSGNAASFAFAALASGTTCTFSYEVRLEDSVEMGQALDLTAAVSWTSLAGALMGERTGTGGVNDYVTTHTSNAVIVDSTTAVSVTTSSTDRAESSGDDRPQGEGGVEELVGARPAGPPHHGEHDPDNPPG
ncbi:MAG: hypothetical protein AAGI01_02905, partial [Myxococcota bacterium]